MDFLISQHMGDGGFNCRSNRSGAMHSSLHSTISVFKGISAYRRAGYTYRREEVEIIAQGCLDFLLLHQLFKSDRTGAVIHHGVLKFPYPWRYNILRALDCLAQYGAA
ncbi:MAG: hypothetical protein MO846_02065 [Candidatus Devosia symbiotica]|nr:hypothetical protein [Candidatus Devosia symbiotica]